MMAVLLFGLLAGCDLLSTIVALPDGRDLETNPGSYNQILAPDERISVRFPHEVLHDSAEAAISIETAAGALDGEFHWEGRTLFFSLDEPPTPGVRHLLLIEGDVLESDGATQHLQVALPFFFGTDESILLSLKETEGGSTIGAKEVIKLRFSRPVAVDTLIRALSISPDTPYNIEWDDSRTLLTLEPETEWRTYTLYRLTLGVELTDEAGAPLDREQRLTYWMEDDTTSPRLISLEAIPADVPPPEMETVPGIDLFPREGRVAPTEALRLRFSEALDRDRTEQALQLHPMPSGDLLWPSDRTLVFLPDEAWAQERLYHLSIDDGAVDLAGNSLANPVAITLRIDLEPLRLIRIRIAATDGGTVASFSGMQALELTSQNPLIHDYTMVFEFSEPFVSEEDKQEALRAIDIERLLSNGLSSPIRKGFSWIGDFSVSITWYRLEPSDADRTNWLLLVIRGGEQGVRSTNGNFLSEDLRQLIRMKP